MKKQYSVKQILLVLIAVSLLVSCSTTDKQARDNEIVNSAIQLAEAKCSLGKFEEAQKIYEDALTHSIDYRLIYNWAISYAKVKDFNNAISIMKQGYELYPDHEEFFNAIVAYQQIINDTKGLIDSYKAYIEKKPNDNNLLLKYMELCLADNDYTQAYRTAIKLWHNHYYTKSVIDTLYLMDPQQWETVSKVL